MKTYNRFGAVVLAAALLLSLTAGAMAESAGIEVELPQGYVEGSPLPLYRAQERTQTEANFFDKVPLEWFNTSGQVYRALGLKDKLPVMPRGEQLALLAGDGMLVKRPILLLDDGRVLVGFKEREWQAALE